LKELRFCWTLGLGSADLTTCILISKLLVVLFCVDLLGRLVLAQGNCGLLALCPTDEADVPTVW